MNEDEFARVFLRLRSGLLRFASRHLDEDAAHDVVATTFETLWRKDLVSPDARGPDDDAWRRFTSLAFAILKGHISNEHRARRRRTSLWKRLVGEAITGGGIDYPGATLESPDAGLQISQWLACLNAPDRQMIVLLEAGLSATEMASILRCSPVAAARRRDRAKQRLRAIISASLGPRRR